MRSIRSRTVRRPPACWRATRSAPPISLASATRARSSASSGSQPTGAVCCGRGEGRVVGHRRPVPGLASAHGRPADATCASAQARWRARYGRVGRHARLVALPCRSSLAKRIEQLLSIRLLREIPLVRHHSCQQPDRLVATARRVQCNCVVSTARADHRFPAPRPAASASRRAPHRRRRAIIQPSVSAVWPSGKTR